MGISSIKVVPTCRYNHGPLTRVAPDLNAPDQRFGWVSAGNISQQFVGILFTCSVCGYSEFFDDEPDVTAADNAENSR